MTAISPELILDQLKKVLASAGFSSSPRLCQFLIYVVEQTLSGRADNIKQYTVAVDGMGFSTGFDPQSNPTVRMHARRLRRELDRYFNRQGIADPIRIDIPKGSYVPIFKRNQNPPSHLKSGQVGRPAPGNATLDDLRPTMAVMMFPCISPDEDCAYLGTGLTDEMIIALTKFKDFVIVGPLSKEDNSLSVPDIHNVGQQYGVRFVLEGTIQVQNETCQLKARLADTLSGHQLWGQTIDYNLQNGSLMAIEKEVVSQVVAAIADSYGVIPRILSKEILPESDDTSDAYISKLHFYHYCRVLTEDSYIQAYNALEKTLQQDPENAFALAALSDLIASTYWWGHESDVSILDRAESMAFKAVALDPLCQQAHFAMALIYLLKFQREMLLHEIEQIIRLNSNNAHYLAASALCICMAGDRDRAMKIMEKAMYLNPHHPGWYHLIAYMYHFQKGNYELALIEARRFNMPVFFWDPLIRAAAFGQLERENEAKKSIEELLAIVPDFNQHGRNLIRRLAFLDEHVDMLVEGLHRAGMVEL